MKKKIFILLTFLLLPIFALADSNHIYSIEMNISIDENGNADVTEIWDVDGSDGTEWYKVINDFGESRITNFTVSMDDKQLTKKNWNINETLNEKKGYYGTNETSNGIELCFGKYDYNRHKFTLKYTITNIIFNTSDSQVLYYNFIDRLSNVSFDDFKITIGSYYSFPDTLDVWGYGYKGYAYIQDGLIKASNEENTSMNNNYVVLLAKFPLNTFNNQQKIEGYDTFDNVLNKSKEGSYTYEYNEQKNEKKDSWDYIIANSIDILFFAFIAYLMIKTANNKKYGYINNKTINKNNTPMFRYIPCNKDLLYANTLIKLNKFNYKETNILGALILKWIRNNKIKYRTETGGVFNKETGVLDLTLNPIFENEQEQRLFNIMYEASEDGILESKEFEKWCQKNYDKFLKYFDNLTEKRIELLKQDGSIHERNNKNECKYKNVMNDKIYNDSKELYGLKLYLEEFSSMDTKEVMDVQLWDEYLMFAYLFGIADKVAKQLKNLYPNIMLQNDIDYYNTIIFVNNISYNSYNAASSARSAAQSYSSGGGGFSSGGGGGGSGGGGGGGSR